MMKVDEKIASGIERNAEEVMELAEWLNDHPEISGRERESSERISAFLSARGYDVEKGYGGMEYAFRAVKKGAAGGEKLKAAFLCEYDALPDVGHACGHSLITGMSILAAEAIKEAYLDFPLRIDLIGTPAEETFGGKAVMAENGAFDGYEFAMMGHPDNFNAPQIKVLACGGMYVTFTGKAAHASTNPWDGINALNAAHIFMQAVDSIRQHIPPLCQAHGILVKGGSAPNTVPDITELNYYYRASNMADMALLREKLENCAKGAAIATGCGYNVNFESTKLYADLSYLPSAITAIKEVFEVLGQPYCEMPRPEGSTDAGNVDLVIPTFHLEISATDEYTSFHTAAFAAASRGPRGKKTLTNGASVMAQYANALAKTPGLLEKIKSEHRAYRR
ncbi:MAG: amidohydrolase [Synergistaceae bacterium]|jgi:amidohydrolase|nr:amidohydrolase [Synergistaceae bacterium]